MIKSDQHNKLDTNLKSKHTKNSSYRIKNRRNEFRLKLPISANVTGKLPNKDSFEEKTKILNISAGGACFGLNSIITIGTKITLHIDLPDELNPNDKTKLKLEGFTVRLQVSNMKNKKQLVAINFYKKYNFISL